MSRDRGAEPEPPLRIESIASIQLDYGATQASFDRINRMLEELSVSLRRHWFPDLFGISDPRKGDDMLLDSITPGDRVFVLEDVFTVQRVDLGATPRTVWLEELPTSPLYFHEYETIPLAKEPKD